MKNEQRWNQMGVWLHRLSYLKIGFYAVAFYYEALMLLGLMRLFGLGPFKIFLHNVCAMALWFGFAMLMEGLRDNEKTAHGIAKKPAAKLQKMQKSTFFGIIGFSLAVLEGLFLIYVGHMEFEGEAITTLGIGGLAFFRLQYDCICMALAMQKKAASQAAPAAEQLG